MFVVSVVCCQVEVSASGRSLFQRYPTECGVSECDREASIMRRPWSIGGMLLHGKKMKNGITNNVTQRYNISSKRKLKKQGR